MSNPWEPPPAGWYRSPPDLAAPGREPGTVLRWFTGVTWTGDVAGIPPVGASAPDPPTTAIRLPRTRLGQ